MEIWQQYQMISRSLNYNAKQKVKQIKPVFLERARSIKDSSSLYATALSMLKPQFPFASIEQINVLAFYLLSSVATAESSQEKIDSFSEISEMESLRLQMMMDRHSKLMSTLSNLLKKISNTSSSIVQNIK